MKINVTRYSEDPTCVEPDGLRKKLLADLMPSVAKTGLQRNRCLVATYIQPSVTKGGVIIPTSTQEEDRWQGKVGLLLTVGPSAFDYEEVRDAIDSAQQEQARVAKENDIELDDDDRNAVAAHAMRSMKIPEIGDWVAYRTSETHEVGIAVGDGHTLVSCRLIIDESIIMRLDDPRIIY